VNWEPEDSTGGGAVAIVVIVWDPPAGYQEDVDAPRGRRIWHFEAELLCEALKEAGAWQAALRVRVAHREALRRDRDGTAFNYRPTPEDVVPLNLALDALRARGHDALRSRNR
jgi:hypothetical protein